MCSLSSIRPYLLWDKFVVIHYRKARNPDEFPFCMVIYLWIHDQIFHLEAWCVIICTLWPISSSDSPVRSTSASIFAAMSPLPPKDSGPNIRTSGKCYANNYRYRKHADCSSSLKLKKCKNLEVKDNDEQLVQVLNHSTSADLRLGWPHKVLEQHQKLYLLRNK